MLGISWSESLPSNLGSVRPKTAACTIPKELKSLLVRSVGGTAIFNRSISNAVGKKLLINGLPGANVTPNFVNGGGNMARPGTNNGPQTPEDIKQFEAQHDLIKVLRANNPYKLDRDGVLQLPGFRSIELAGLSEAEATRRVSFPPAV